MNNNNEGGQGRMRPQTGGGGGSLDLELQELLETGNILDTLDAAIEESSRAAQQAREYEEERDWCTPCE